MYLAGNGYQAGVENPQGPAIHCRRRYRLLPNPANPAKSGNPSLWIVHYHRADRFESASRIPIGLAEQQILQSRRWLQSQGQLMEKKFMLADAPNWPVVVLPQGQPSHPGTITFGGVPIIPQGRMQQLQMAQQVYPTDHGPSPKRARHGNTAAQRAAAPRAVPHPQPAVEEEDFEEMDRRDLFDILTQRDISQLRFKQHSEWMEELYSDYATYEIQPVDLGLGRTGFMKPITEGYFSSTVRSPTPENRDPNKVREHYKTTIAQPMPAGKPEEFYRHVQKKIESNAAEMNEMTRVHELQMQSLRQGQALREAADRLRGTVNHETSRDAKSDGERTPGNGTASNSRSSPLKQTEQIEDIVKRVEGLLNKQIKAREEVKLVNRGGLIEEANSKSKSAIANSDQMASLFDDFLEPGVGGDPGTSTKPSPSPQPVSSGLQPSEQVDNTEDWVVVDKQDTQPQVGNSNPGSVPGSNPPPVTREEGSLNDADLGTDLVDFGGDTTDNQGFDNNAFDAAIDFGDLDTAGEAMEGYEGEGDGVDMGMNLNVPTSSENVPPRNNTTTGVATVEEVSSEQPNDLLENDDGMDVMEDSAFGDAFHHTEAEAREQNE
jgi:hypothetical protein